MPENDQKLNIICLSNQLWDFPNWTNKRHVMSRLAEQGHNILFVDPPINTGKVFFKQIRRGLWSPLRLLKQQKKDRSGALVYTPLNILPLPNVTSSLHIERIKNIAGSFFDRKRKTVLWVYHVQIPNLDRYLDNLSYEVLLYDCVDNYAGFPAQSGFYSAIVPKEKVISQENMLADRSNLVFATAPGLVEKMQEHNKRVFFTPNVGDYERFKKSVEMRNNKEELPSDLKDIPRPRIGFTGSLDEYKFDSGLMRKIALDHPDLSFVLIGQIALKDSEAGLQDLGLADLPNVHFLGFKPFETLPKYFAGFDAYIIPYQLNDYTVGGCFPIKFHDSLAAGLPTVVTNLPAYTPFGNVSYIAKNHEEFSTYIKQAVEEDNEVRIKERLEVASQNSWGGKVATLLQHISSVL